MTNTRIKDFSDKAYDYVVSAVKFNDVYSISTEYGNAVLISQEEYDSLKETLYLLSAPDMKRRLEEAQSAKPEDWLTLEEMGF